MSKVKVAIMERAIAGLVDNNIYDVVVCDGDAHAEIKSMTGCRIVEVDEKEAKLLQQRMADSTQLQVVLWQKYVQASPSISEEKLKAFRKGPEVTQ